MKWTPFKLEILHTVGPALADVAWRRGVARDIQPEIARLPPFTYKVTARDDASSHLSVEPTLARTAVIVVELQSDCHVVKRDVSALWEASLPHYSLKIGCPAHERLRSHENAPKPICQRI